MAKPFDPAGMQSPADPGERVFRTVLEHLARDPLDLEALKTDIAIALRPKLESDAALLQGTGPLTFAQFAGLVERVQGWKGAWLREHIEIAATLLRHGLSYTQSPLNAVNELLARFTEREDEIIMRVPVHQAGDVAMVTLKGWSIPLSAEELAEKRIKGVRGT